MEGGIKQVNDANPGVLEGNGSEADPYTINCIEDLVAFAYNVNSYNPNNNTGTLYTGQTVALALDLDFQSDKSYANPETKYILDDNGYTPNPSGTAIKTLLTDTNGLGFIPIGNGKSDGFAGIFDGQNHVLINLYENSRSYGGLFGTTNKELTISNLGVKSENIIGPAPAGGILGYANSTATITNCYNTGNITSGSASAGGIIGIINSTATITDCYNSGNVTSSGATGGILGYANSTSTISNSYNTGDVTSTNNATGGILGYANSTSTISNSYNTGDVTATNNVAGGILGGGNSTNTITNCNNSGNINGYNQSGGVMGFGSNATIMNCNNTGIVEATNAPAGGIIGQITEQENSTNTVTNCNNTGNIKGYETGGIIGKASQYIEIRDCYVTGNLEGNGFTGTGGIIGNMKSGTIVNCCSLADIISNSMTGGIVGFQQRNKCCKLL